MGFRTSVHLPERFTGQAVIAGHTVTEVFGKLLPLCEEGMQEPDMAVAALIWELLASFCRGDKPRDRACRKAPPRQELFQRGVQKVRRNPAAEVHKRNASCRGG